jgi:hypothetical protein
LEEGHEVWLLQTRLHPLNPANNATIEDIGKYDIPAGMENANEHYTNVDSYLFYVQH